MDRVGGYLGLLALEQDAHDYEDVLIAMVGESQARRIARLEKDAGRHG